MYYAFANHINSSSSMSTYVPLVWQTYLLCVHANNYGHCTCVHLQICTAYSPWSVKLTVSIILHLWATFILEYSLFGCHFFFVLFSANAYEISTAIMNISHLAAIFSFTSMITYRFLPSRHFSFSLCILISFEIVQTCVSIQKLIHMNYYADSLNYFTFVSHICSFTSMICLVLYIWQSCFFLQVFMTFLLKFIKIYIKIVHTCAYIQNTTAHDVFSWEPKIFDIYKPYLFLHIYDPFSNPYLAVILFFFYAYEYFSFCLT